MARNRLPGAWGAAERISGALGLGLELGGELLADDGLTEIGEAVRRGHARLPELREAVKNNAPKAAGDAAEALTRSFLSIFDEPERK